MSGSLMAVEEKQQSRDMARTVKIGSKKGAS
jgi:hypothetical protein